jgi:hypothetical protein
MPGFCGPRRWLPPPRSAHRCASSGGLDGVRAERMPPGRESLRRRSRETPRPTRPKHRTPSAARGRTRARDHHHDRHHRESILGNRHSGSLLRHTPGQLGDDAIQVGDDEQLGMAVAQYELEPCPEATVRRVPRSLLLSDRGDVAHMRAPRISPALPVIPVGFKRHPGGRDGEMTADSPVALCPVRTDAQPIRHRGHRVPEPPRVCIQQSAMNPGSFQHRRGTVHSDARNAGADGAPAAGRVPIVRSSITPASHSARRT